MIAKSARLSRGRLIEPLDGADIICKIGLNAFGTTMDGTTEEDRAVAVARLLRRRALHSRIVAYILMASLVGLGCAVIYGVVQTITQPNIQITAEGSNNNFSVDTQTVDWLAEITKSILRIGSFIMAVFIINILNSFVRYNLRSANYLDSRADCISLYSGDVGNLEKLMLIMSIDRLDFNKTPMSPFDSYINAIQSAVGRSSEPKQ